MAISDLMPGLAVNIKVNGQILKEYNDSDLAAEDRTVTRYIEAVSGDIFEIGLQVEKGFRFFGDALSFDVHVDGSDKVDGPLIRREKCIGGEHTRISKGCRLPDDQVKLYQFASVKTAADGYAPRGETARVKELGTIVVKVGHATIGAPKAPVNFASSISELGVISEKALKGQAVSHSVGFTPAVRAITRLASFHASPVAGVTSPFTTFIFSYRSLEALKSMLIIPRTPSPPPLEERDIATLSPDELRELLKRARAARNLLSDEKEAKVKIKRERDDYPRPRKLSRPSSESTLLEIDDDGHVRASSTTTLREEPEVIELD